MFRRTALGVAALAGATLLLETSLTRLLAVAQFYHFAFLVVSLALLGFGASGSLLGLVPALGRTSLPRLLAWCGVAFAFSTLVAYAVVNLLPFDSYSIAWDRRQIALFVLYYLALTLPFLAAGVGIGAALAGSRGESHRVYAANLLGSAAGVLLAPVMLALAGVPGAVLASGLIALLPALVENQKYWNRGFSWVLARRSQPADPKAGYRTASSPELRTVVFNAGRYAFLLFSITVLVGLVLLSVLNLSGRGVVGLTLSPYKGLVYAQRYPGARALFGQWNAISRVDVLADAGTRLLPGLSYTYAGPAPRQLGLSVDGDSMMPAPLEGPAAFQAASFLPEAVVFQLRPAAHVLILEPGGGLAVIQALAGGAGQVVAVTGNPLVRRAVARATAVADPYALPGVTVVTEPARARLARDPASYDIAFLPLTDSYRPVASGAYSLAETYNLTVEGLSAALARLAPGGILVVTRWLQTPPSEDLRLIAALVEASARRGVSAPADTLVAYRGIQTITALVNPGGWTADELAAARGFTAARRYDLVWAPDIRPDEVNRFNRMPAASHYEAVTGLLAAGDRAAFYRGWPYAVEPPTDDRPFFFHFFRWSQTPQVLATLGRTWQPFGGSGYLVLFALLALVLVLSGALIVLPLALRGGSARRPTEKSSNRSRGFSRFPAVRVRPADPKGGYRAASITEYAVLPPRERLRVFSYFGLLGVAFLFVEIPLIQRWLLVMGHATYAFTLVVLVVLLGSSLGSTWARAAWLPRRGALAALAGLALLTAVAGRPLADAALGWPTAARVAAAAVSLAPLAVLMGLPFPLGLAWLEACAPGWTPWAWAVNGCASVVASVLAAILALSLGFTAVICLGAGAYAAAMMLLPGNVQCSPVSGTNITSPRLLA